MTKNCNDLYLTENRVDLKFILFYQLWKELTDKRTLDSYQFRVMNTLSILEELRKVITQRLKRFHNSNNNIDECKREALGIVKNDPVLHQYYPIIQNRLLCHLSEKTESDSQQRTLLVQLDYSLHILKQDYFEKLVHYVEYSINAHDVSAIMKSTNQLISSCLDRGWSVDALYEVIATLKDSMDNSDKWNEFKEKLSGNNQTEYHILIPLKSRALNTPGQDKETAKQKVLEEIVDMGIETREKSAILNEYPFIEGKNIESNQTYLCIKVTAHDFYSASHLAISKLGDILNILSFYSLIEPWNIRDINWHAINPERELYRSLKSKDLYSTYDYLEGANKIFRSSKELNRSAPAGIQAKLRATYSYANMGKVSYAQEEKYINTWVALESLCRTELYENIISNVLEIVPPALCLRYIYRHFRNFAEDCLRCGVNFDLSVNAVVLRHPSKEKVVRDIIVALQNETSYQEILQKCSVNMLLKERCQEMYRLATDENEMFNRIDRHYVNVRRQLSRLYRIRNEIAHSALNDGVSLIRYIEHLDDYLSEFVSEVVTCWEKSPESNIEHIFEIIKDNYQAYTDIRNSKKSVEPLTLLSGLRETGIIALI